MTLSAQTGKLTSSKAKERVDRLNLPEDFIWKIGKGLLLDLEPFLPPEIQIQFSKLIRGRDFLAYLEFCSDLGPSTLSRLDSLDAKRSTKMLTFAENYPMECEGLDRSAETLRGFWEAEDACRCVNGKKFPEIFGDSRDALFSPQLLRARRFCFKVLGSTPDLVELLDCSKHGPGSDTATERSRTSIFDKYANPPYEVNARARPLLIAAICSDSRWMRSLIAAYLDWPGFQTVNPSSYSIIDVSGCSPPDSWKWRKATTLKRFCHPYFRKHYWKVGNILAFEAERGAERNQVKSYNWGRAFQILFPTDESAGEFWDWAIKTCDYNRYAEVPKTAKKNRSIALEPRGSVYLQLGAGELIRRRLKQHAGINLWSQDKNKSLAYWASKDDSCTTLDLSSASDRIAQKLVEFLLPTDWYDLLVRLRSPKAKIGDVLVPLEKMASMGNGYSFALESLVFTALLVGVIGEKSFFEESEEIAVYGDDLIFPTKYFMDFQLLLTLVGCKVNRKKTYFRGPFRESCGSDFFDGFDVRPLYLKKQPERAFELVIMYNRFYRLFKRWDLGTPRNLESLVLKWLPKGARLFGPDHVTPEWWWIFTDDLSCLRSVVKREFMHEYHAFHLFFRRLHVSRKPQHIPKKLRCYFGELQEQYRKPGVTWDELLFDTELPFGSGTTPIGRNCPIEVSTRLHLVQIGAARYQSAKA